ncbi:hypothetical protein [Puniceicoccus vermicola]|uniref:Uncharacterized protein n=1 Tax=Puniceicoccus vermicola TaxID=388746 RepID=A0A7X1E5U3_9BACT|nr:hypothetical protein [Puniceicoccus vermicola]MBC2603499.1 hypothetical protein [Puniceicoccus vermicola]
MKKEELKYEAKITGYTFLASVLFFPSLFWFLISETPEYIDPYPEWITEFYGCLFRPSIECIGAWIILLVPASALQIIRTIIFYWEDPQKLKEVFRVYRPIRKSNPRGNQATANEANDA